MKPNWASFQGAAAKEPKIICTSCGSNPGKTNRHAQTHFNKYLGENGLLSCTPYTTGNGPNPDLKAARVAWYTCVINEGFKRYLGKKAECPICFNETSLVPVCEWGHQWGHLVCEDCGPNVNMQK